MSPWLKLQRALSGLLRALHGELPQAQPHNAMPPPADIHAEAVGERYEIRQQVCTVNRRWLVVINSGSYLRPIQAEYDRLVTENPEAYFELVHVRRTEDCLAFTPKLDS